MRRIILVCACLALLGAGCGKKENTTSTKDTTSSGTVNTQTQAACDAKATSEAGKKPTITIPECAAPKTLVSFDVIIGAGAELTAGRTATVHYVGVSWSNSQQFDASWDRGQTFPTTIPGQVIAGWNEGLIGMKAGGRRLLTIPPDKGYGPSGQGSIGPNETLVFAIDLVKVS